VFQFVCECDVVKDTGKEEYLRPFIHIGLELQIKRILSAITVTSLYQSFTYKMAAKTSWHRYGTKLRHCHPIYVYRTRNQLHDCQNYSKAVGNRCVADT